MATPDSAELPRASLWPRARRSHTHETVENILSRLEVGAFERFTLWLSKTDYYVLANCTFHTRKTLSGLGLMVMATTLIAFLTGFYMAHSTLIDPESAWNLPLSLLIGSLYAFIIMLIDREIVGATNSKSKVAFLARLVFAVALALAMSYPVKMKFFEGRLEKEIKTMVEERNQPEREQIAQLVTQGEQERLQMRASLMQEIESLDKEIAVLDIDIAREQTEGGCGARCQGLMERKKLILAERSARNEALGKIAAPGDLPEPIRAQVARLEERINGEIANSFDFLNKWEAMGRLSRDPSLDYHVLSWFIILFFLALELAPLIIKWSLGKSEYHYYIEARTHIGNQKIIAISNLFMDAMKENPRVALFLPPEITDIIAAHMEDEAIETANPTTSGLIDLLDGRLPVPDQQTGPEAPTAAPVRTAADSPTRDENLSEEGVRT
jgi:hypothetical protein